jgi:RimJ/RimL family protein N-acetyltransferase
MKERRESDYLPRTQNFTFKIIRTNQEANELALNGFQDFRLRWRNAKRGLKYGGVAFCIFVEHELAHIGWVAFNKEAKDTFDPLPYHVNFSVDQACTGGTWTNPKYRSQGLMTYIYFKRFEFLRQMGIKTTRNAVEKYNITSQKVHAKFGFTVLAEAHYLRLIYWYFKKEKQLRQDNATRY